MATTYKYGIDFGTTNSSIALYSVDNSGMKNIEVFDVNHHSLIDKKLLPSVVYYDKTGQKYVGSKAKIEATKRHIPSNEKKLISKAKIDYLDKYKCDKKITLYNEEYVYVSDIIGEIVKELKRKADDLHIHDIDGIVFGVPVKSDDNCKDVLIMSTVKAGIFENFEDAKAKVEFLSEPVAVALDYGLTLNSDVNAFVFDFGGGTLDIAIVELHKDEKHQVIAKDRITIGGEMYTELFFKRYFLLEFGKEKFINEFGYETFMDEEDIWDKLKNDRLGLEFIEELEKVKCLLSFETEEEVNFHSSDENRDVAINNFKLQRSGFENVIRNSLREIQDTIDQCLGQVNYNRENIDVVLMAGGSSLIPSVIETVQQYFGIEKVKNPNNKALTSIVKGLAAFGYEEDGEEWLEDVAGSNYGIWIEDEQRIEYIVRSNTKVSKTKFDKRNIDVGTYVDLKKNSDAIPVVKVFQNDELIGEFSLPSMGSGKYRVYYEIDEKKGWLKVHILDRQILQWYDDKLEHKNEIRI